MTINSDSDSGLARKDRILTAARSIADALRADKHMHQEHAAVLAGISRSSYWRYMGGTSELDEEFQAIVLPAVHEQAQANMREAESAVGSAENGSGAWSSWYKWKLDKTYRKIYGDLAQEVKLELTGKDGGPVEVKQTISREQALAELRELAASDPTIAAAVAGVLKANGGE